MLKDRYGHGPVARLRDRVKFGPRYEFLFETRDVDTILQTLQKKKKIHIVGNPVIVDRPPDDIRTGKERRLNMGYDNPVEVRTRYMFVVPRKDNWKNQPRNQETYDTDVEYIRSAFHKEAPFFVMGESISRGGQYEGGGTYTFMPHNTEKGRYVLFPGKFIFSKRLRQGIINEEEAIEIFVLPSRAVAQYMHDQFAQGNRVSVVHVDKNLQPLPMPHQEVSEIQTAA